MVEDFDISYILQNSQLKILKVLDIGLQKYRDYKFRICGKDSTPLPKICQIKLQGRVYIVYKYNSSV